jgi:hypothetical protein
MTGTIIPAGRGRHRLGAAGLRHCRDLDAVRERLGGTRPGGQDQQRTGRERRIPPERQDQQRTGRERRIPPERQDQRRTAPEGQDQRRPAQRRPVPGQRDQRTGAAHRYRGRLARSARWTTTVVGAVVAAVLAISGWYTAAGAGAVAQMITR